MKKLLMIVLVLMLLTGSASAAILEADKPMLDYEERLGIQAQRGVVLCKSLSVHAEPNGRSRKITTLTAGDSFITWESENGWYNCYYDEGKDVAWVRSAYVVLDPMYGVSKTSLSTILLTARCDVDVIHERHDTLFGGRLPAPTSSTLAALRTFVVENNCDIGLATDGDADRIGVIDDEANFLHPNEILVLLYYYLVRYKGWRGPAVRNIATTHLLDKVAESYGETCYEVPVGFKHISAKMIETNAVIGGESSGGLTVRGHIQGKDGIYAAALLVEMLAVTGRKLTEIYKEITDEFGEFKMAERDYRFTQQRKQEINHLLMVEKKLPEFSTEVDHVSYMDGCKVYFKNGGWIICRFSGTEPLIRIFCEMSTMEQADRVADEMKTFLGL